MHPSHTSLHFVVILHLSLLFICRTAKERVVPFRESRLTRLFQTYFSGKGKACMLVNISPAASSFDENIQALKFSAIGNIYIHLYERLLWLMAWTIKGLHSIFSRYHGYFIAFIEGEQRYLVYKLHSLVLLHIAPLMRYKAVYIFIGLLYSYIKGANTTQELTSKFITH